VASGWLIAASWPVLPVTVRDGIGMRVLECDDRAGVGRGERRIAAAQHLAAGTIAGALQEQPHPDWQLMALDISRRLGIRTVVRITEGTWEVLSLGDAPPRRFAAVASAACSLTRDDEHRCPMQLAPGNGEYCSMRGGPWTSSSIHAAAGWRDQRDRLVAAIGCDTCEGTRHQFQGKILSSGGPITIVPTPTPTRWLAPDGRRLGTKG
jgi:hypothetical protein